MPPRRALALLLVAGAPLAACAAILGAPDVTYEAADASDASLRADVLDAFAPPDAADTAIARDADDAAPTDASVDSPSLDAAIHCQNTTCPAATQECCLNFSGQDQCMPGHADTCVFEAGPNAVVACDDYLDCVAQGATSNGQICCGWSIQFTNTFQSACLTPADCTARQGVTLCDPRLPSECPDACAPWMPWGLNTVYSDCQ